MTLRMALGFSVLAAWLTVSASAQATGMDAMRYYVGTWKCKGAPVGQGWVSTGTATYTLSGDVLHERLVIPPNQDTTKTYVLNVRTTYDAAKHRYVSASVDSNENWSVMYASPPMTPREQWIDHQTSSGKHGRTNVIRYNDRTFATYAFPTADRGAQPNFRSFCHREMAKTPAS
jgi:hypothetical protein